MEMSKAKRLDKALAMFKGNSTLFWIKLQEKYGTTHEYFVLENDLKHLLGDGMIEENKEAGSLFMTNKGWSKFTSKKGESYEAITKREQFDFGIKIGLGILSILTFTILIFNTCKGFSKKQESSAHNEDSVIKSKKLNVVQQVLDTQFVKTDSAQPKVDTLKKQKIKLKRGQRPKV